MIESFVKTHPIEFVAVLLLTVAICLSNLSKNKDGEFRIPAVCVLVAFMLPAFVGHMAGTSVGLARVEEGRTREGTEYDTVETRKVSGAERWNRADFFTDGIWLCPLLVVGVSWVLVGTARVQAKLTAMEEKIDYFNSEPGARFTEFEKFRYRWAGLAVFLLIGLSTGLTKP